MFKESEKIELKESFAEWKEIIISLVAFANRSGGKAIVGVNDDGVFTNLQIGRKTIEDFVNKLKLNTDPVLYPSINVKEFGLGEYVEIEIPESVNNIIDTSWIRTLNERYFKADATEPEHILQRINVIADNHFTNAGYLCFANDINQFPNAIIRMARFKGETPDVFLDMKNSTVNLIQSVSEVFTFITRSVNMRVEIGKQADGIYQNDQSLSYQR